ncbi:Uncharacterised protein [Vibrio cholerae]|nr:Uncharacterised protein [Vibrio cholerae]
MNALVIAQQFTYRFKLDQKQLGRVNAEHLLRPFTQHAPHVIAVATTHIKYQTVFQWRDVWQ